MPLQSPIPPETRRPLSMETILKARAMYVERHTVSRILAACGMSFGTLYHCLDGGPPDANGTPLLPPIPRRRAGVVKRRRPLTADRLSLASRLLRTAEGQVREIELRLAQPSGATPARERDVRMLAMLVRSLRDLSSLNAALALEAKHSEPLEPSLQQKIENDRKLRELEQTNATTRHMLKYLREVWEIEKIQRGRAQAAAQVEARKEDEEKKRLEFAEALSRRIEGFAAAHRAEQERGEGG